MVFVRKLMFLRYSCQKPTKKNYGRTAFFEELLAARNFPKVSLNFNKIPNSLRQILQKYSKICIFVYYKKSPTEPSGKD